VSEREFLVLDASVGVKWFRDERGTEDALTILHAAASGLARVAAPTHFAHELLAVVERRGRAPRRVVEAWSVIVDSGIEIIPLADEVVREASLQCDALGCTFYDALAPAIASLLDATLVSADARAHGDYLGVRLIG
jgi:predicted nucleic acid-binding protein